MVNLILHIIIIVSCIFLILLLGLIFIPFDYNFCGYVNESIYGTANVKWLFGLTRFVIYKEKKVAGIKVKLNFCGVNIFFNKNKKVRIKSKKKNKKKNSKKSSNKKMKITKKLISICYNYFKDMVNIFKPKCINVSGTYGFDDPSITGVVCGVLSVINSTVPNSVINIEPEFEDEVYDLEIKFNGRIIVLIILFKTIRFIFSRGIIKGIFKNKRKNMKLLKS